jgi:DNA polymerase (family X)
MASATAERDATRRAGVPNARIADALDDVARLLDAQQASGFRVGAYRGAAATIRALPVDVATLVAEHGRAGLEALPGIGSRLASAILELHETGHLAMLERLRGELPSEELIATLPGIGAELAHRIHEHLGIETLEELEIAAWDGRLATTPGFGARRVASLRAQLDARLGRRMQHTRRAGGEASAVGAAAPAATPTVAELLSVDGEYRAKAGRGELERIAPRRFNPTHEAWLPILHTERGRWHCHALFSNTARAHELGRTKDWVVLFYDHDGAGGQATVVTERHGPLAGLRVVRGRERECEAHWAARGEVAWPTASRPASPPARGLDARMHRYLLR